MKYIPSLFSGCIADVNVKKFIAFASMMIGFMFAIYQALYAGVLFSKGLTTAAKNALCNALISSAYGAIAGYFYWLWCVNPFVGLQ